MKTLTATYVCYFSGFLFVMGVIRISAFTILCAFVCGVKLPEESSDYEYIDNYFWDLNACGWNMAHY